MTLFALPFRVALGYGSLADPPGSSVVGAAVGWLGGTLLGTLATSVAVIAVAAVGYAMLTGRIDVRRGAAAILGAFLLFGAAQIVAGLQSALSASAAAGFSETPIPPPPATSPQPAPLQASEPVDPYAGASVPTR